MFKTVVRTLKATSAGGGGSSSGNGDGLDPGEEEFEDTYALARAVMESLDSAPAAFASSSSSSSSSTSQTSDDHSPPHALPPHVSDPSTFPFVSPDVEAQSSANKVEAYRATQYIRDDWIRKQMRARSPSFTKHRQISVLMGTYNAAGKKPEGLNVDPIVSAIWSSTAGGASPPHIAVFGFQEIVDLNVQNAITDSQTLARSEQWAQMLASALGRFQPYHLVAQKSLVGILVCAFVASSLVPHVRNVQTTLAATGVFGMVGNKGACAVRLEVFDTSLCFVVAHLAAHQEAVEARNQNVRDINLKAQFPLDPPPRSSVPERHHPRIAATSLEALQAGTLALEDHDYEFWLGDFNYRLDASVSPLETIDQVRRKDLMSLRERDQLEREMRAGRVFSHLREVSPLCFFPTYKFEPGTDEYEQRPDKKLRSPAWTDRILSPKDKPVDCLGYDRIDAVRLSDHKPVAALVRVDVSEIEDAKREVEYKALLQRLGERSSTTSASASTGSSPTAGPKPFELLRAVVEPPTLDFGELRFKESAERVLTIRNAGVGVLVWRFAPRPGDAPWRVASSEVRLQSAYGLLLPGETTTVRVVCRPDMPWGDGPLAETLDLRVHLVKNQRDAMGRASFLPMEQAVMGASTSTSAGGSSGAAVAGEADFESDQFPIHVRCQRARSCFGASLVSLMPPEGGVAPVPLARLLGKLLQDGALDKQYRLFLTPSDSEEQLRLVRMALDSGTEFPRGVSPHVLSAAVLEFLDRLRDPVVPPDVMGDDSPVAQWSSSDDFSAAEFFAALPPVNANTLALVVAAVKRVVASSDSNRSSLALLAPVFALVLFRPGNLAEFNKESQAVKASGLGEFASWLTASAASAVAGSSGGGGGGGGGGSSAAGATTASGASTSFAASLVGLSNAPSSGVSKDKMWERCSWIFSELVMRA